MLKKLAVVIIAILVLGLLGGFLMPSSYDVERSIVVQRDAATIYPYLSSPRKWQEWTPWTKERYPQMTTEYSGPEMGAGAKSSWVDPDNGNGSMVMTKADPKKGVHYDLSFEGWSKSEGRLLMEEADGGTKVVMGMRGDFGMNPVYRYFGLMMDGAMGAEFEQGLAKLKRVVEALPEKPAEPKMASTPFSAEEIRAATKPGRMYKLRVETPGEATVFRTIEFTEVSDDQVVMKITTADESGKPIGEPETKRATWEELRSHALYPEASTSVSEAEVEVPAGKFSCKLYTVTQEGSVTKAWFAKALPGAPVQHEVTKDGAVTRMVLVEHTPGK